MRKFMQSCARILADRAVWSIRAMAHLCEAFAWHVYERFPPPTEEVSRILTPSVIAKEALFQLENNLVMGNLIARDYEK